MSVFGWREAPAATFAVIGDPIAHSLSPRMFARAIPEEYVAIHVVPEELEEALHHLADLGYLGLNVTLPHKVTVMRWAYVVSEEAHAIGAANTLHLPSRGAHNTDGIGFRAMLGDRPAGTALVLGAGGSARAVLWALQGWKIRLWNRTRENAEAFAEIAEIVDQPRVEGCDVVVNTTSAHHGGARVPLEWDAVPLALDLSYDAAGLTPFLIEASAWAEEMRDGREMLVGQGAASYHWWTGRHPDVQQMREAVGL